MLKKKIKIAELLFCFCTILLVAMLHVKHTKREQSLNNSLSPSLVKAIEKFYNNSEPYDTIREYINIALDKQNNDTAAGFSRLFPVDSIESLYRYLGHLAYRENKFGEACTHYHMAKHINSISGKPIRKQREMESTYCFYLGWLHQLAGNTDSSEIFYNKQIAESKLITLFDPSLEETYNNLGIIYYNREDYYHSILYFLQSLKYLSYQPKSISKKESVGKTLKNIGACFMELKDYKNAKMLFNLALSQYSSDEMYDRAKLSQLLGFVSIKTEALDSALIYLTKSEDLIVNNNQATVQHFQINLSKCLVYLMQKDYINAKMTLDSLNTILNTTDELSKLFSIRQKIISSVYYDSLYNYSDAINCLKEANTINYCNKTGKILYPSIYTESLFKIGRLYYKLYSFSHNHNHRDSSIAIYRNAINQLNRTSSEIFEDKSKILYQQYVHSYIKEYLTILIEPHDQFSQTNIEKIINTSELSKYYVLTNSITNKKKIPIKHSQFIIEEFLNKLTQSPKNINYALENIPFISSIQITRKDSLKNRPKEVNLNYIQSQLDSIDIIINYIQSSEYFYCCLIKKTHILFFKLGSIKTISEEIQNCNKALKKFQKEDSMKQMLSGLYSSLLAPLMDHIPDNSNIFFIPEGVLTRAPFDCLWDGKSYLIENQTIINCFNLESWKQQIGGIDSIPGIHFYAPSIDFSNATYISNLPYSNNEIKNCISICRTKRTNSMQYISKDANKENFYNSLNSPNIVHLSSHMHFSNINSDYNFLYLNDKGSPDSFYQWDLIPQKTKTPFVILSTCYSGEGIYYESEGIDSFVRSFYIYGVDNIVYTRWNIEDRFSSFFFPEFYKNLLSSLSIPITLRKTKMHFINSPEYSHPAYWAAINSI